MRKSTLCVCVCVCVCVRERVRVSKREIEMRETDRQTGGQKERERI